MPASTVARDVALTTFLLLFSAACSDTTAPRGTTGGGALLPLDVGDTTAGYLAAADTVGARYALHAVTAGEISIFFQAETDGVEFHATDSATGTGLAFIVPPADYAPGHLLNNRTPSFLVAAGQTIELEVRQHLPLGGTAGRYRIYVYPINPAPEHISPTLALGDTVTGEILDNPADVDEFTYTPANTHEMIGYLLGSGTQAGRDLFLGFYAPGSGDTFGAASSGGTDSDLELQNTGVVSVQSGVPVRVVVRQFGLNVDSIHPGTGPYTFQLHLVDRHPEHVPAALVPGDTVAGESLDYVGDIDEFTLPAAANQSFNIFLQGTSGVDSSYLELQGDFPLSLSNPLQARGTDSSLMTHYTGRFTAPQAASYHLTVVSSSLNSGHRRGAYRLWPALINPLPEQGPTGLTLGDTLAGEALDLPGDVDRITLTVPHDTLASLVLWRPSGSPLGPNLSMPYQAGTIQFQVLPDFNFAPEAGEGSSRFPLAAGTYTLEIRSDGGEGQAYTGGYRLETFVIDSAPENRSATFAIGDTVNGRIDVDGDLDVYQFSGVRGQQLDFQFQGLGPASAWSFAATLTDSSGATRLHGLGTLAVSGTLAGHRTGRFELPADGTYRITVSGATNGTDGGEVADYRFTLQDLGVQVEHGVSTLAAGDSIGAERIDSLGDVDEFLVTGAPGDEVVLVVNSNFGWPAAADIFFIGSPVSVEHVVLAGTVASNIRTLPASGQLRVRVGETRSALGPADEITDAFHATGPYSIWLLPVQRAPETVSAAIALGDTISGESLNPQGDIDEYTFSGLGGSTVTAYLNTPAGFGGNAAVLQVLEPGTGTVLGTVSSSNGATNLTDQSTGPILLPATGVYTVRVSQQVTHPTNCPYIFLVQ